MPAPRLARWTAAICLAATIALGLLSRRFPLPGWFAEHAGDALYATAAGWALAIVWPALADGRRALAAFACAAAIECSQLVRTDWLAALRATRLGALVLGQGFQWDDFAAYALGAALGWLWAKALRAVAGRPDANVT